MQAIMTALLHTRENILISTTRARAREREREREREHVCISGKAEFFIATFADRHRRARRVEEKAINVVIELCKAEIKR